MAKKLCRAMKINFAETDEKAAILLSGNLSIWDRLQRTTHIDLLRFQAYAIWKLSSLGTTQSEVIVRKIRLPKHQLINKC